MEYATAALSVLKFLFDLSVADLGAPQWVEGKGEYAITREISEREACARSEKQAKLNALRKAGGERISSDTLMSCTDEDCPITQFTWNAFDGLIEDIKDKTVTEKIIPSGKYHLRVDHPNVEGDASEYLHVLATRKPIRFLDTYALEKFHARVLEIPKQDRRYIRKPYRIVR